MSQPEKIVVVVVVVIGVVVVVVVHVVVVVIPVVDPRNIQGVHQNCSHFSFLNYWAS